LAKAKQKKKFILSEVEIRKRTTNLYYCNYAAKNAQILNNDDDEDVLISHAVTVQVYNAEVVNKNEHDPKPYGQKLDLVISDMNSLMNR
jgi:hypothetical protein